MDQPAHHMWCIQFGNVIEGACQECERLRRQYPPLGHLDYAEELRYPIPHIDAMP